MGEIKSTLEIAMERTKKFAISEGERKEMKQKEIFQKATSLFHRYREGHPLNEILKEIEKMEKKTAIVVKEALLSQWVDALSMDDDSERILNGIEALKKRGIDEVKEKFRHLLSQYQQEKETLREKTNLQLTDTLKKEGIYGSAVEPKPEGSGFWKKEIDKLDQSYRMKLEEIKKVLRSL